MMMMMMKEKIHQIIQINIKIQQETNINIF